MRSDWRSARRPTVVEVTKNVRVDWGARGIFTRAKQAAEKREFLEGDGLQAVHKCFAVNPALAAEGAAFAPYSTFFRSL